MVKEAARTPHRGESEPVKASVDVQYLEKAGGCLEVEQWTPATGAEYGLTGILLRYAAFLALYDT